MKKSRSNMRGQSTLEYAIIITVVIGALLAMQIYMKRGLEGKLKDASDNIGSQYSAGKVTSAYTTTTSTTSAENTSPDGSSSTLDTSSNITGNEAVQDLNVEQVIQQ
ncbi:hypothetical protein EPO66_04495 [bacterium]|nr:MAG: hypothetical protein EPO66_04495 [bacterium]